MTKEIPFEVSPGIRGKMISNRHTNRTPLLWVVLLHCISSSLWGTPITIKYTSDRGTVRLATFDSESTQFRLSDLSQGAFELVKVEGLDQFRNLETLSAGKLAKMTDFSVLSSLKSVKYLYMNMVTISDFHFLEGMEGLEKVHLNFWVPKPRQKAVISEPIDLSKLKNLAFILAWSSDYLGILPLANAVNKPFLSLDNNQIGYLKPRDLAILRQFGGISIAFNPINSIPEERAKLAGMEVFFEDSEDFPPQYQALYDDFEN